MKEKFTVRRVLDLYTLLSSEKEHLDKVYTKTSFDSVTPSWVMEVTGPGHTLLLHDEAAAASEEYTDWKTMQNRAILIEAIFAQCDQAEKVMEACQSFMAELQENLESIKHRHIENLGKLTDAVIIATLVQNDIQKVEQMADGLSRVVREHKEAIQRHQNAINHCAKLIFDPSLRVIDRTLEEKFVPIEQNCAQMMREIDEFKAQITERQLPLVPIRADNVSPKSEAVSSKAAEISAANDYLGHDTVEDKAEKLVAEEDSTLLQVTDISSIADNSENEMPAVREMQKEEQVLLEDAKTPLEAETEHYILEEIDISEANDNAVEPISIYSDRKLSSGSEKSPRAIQLHESADLHEYTQKVMASLRYWDRPEKSDLLGPSINYRAVRVQAIKRLVHQLALSLALNHSQEEIDLLYRWIEICRGKSPQERLLNPNPLDQRMLDRIQQDPVLSEIYFKLPRDLQRDLHPKAEERAQKTGIINSTRSIDDTELNEDQIAGQWTRFINQELKIENEFQEGSSQSRLHNLMQSLNTDIALRGSVDGETISLWKKQLKAAYKMYEMVKGIPSEERLVTQEPLTAEEYQLIQTHPGFKPIFISLPEVEQEKLRQERYKSTLLNVLAAKVANTPGLLTIQGNLSHDRQLNDDALVQAGEAESVRGFRFLVENDFFQYQLKYEANEKLIGILEEKGFNASEARSVLGFMREQVVYSIFTYFLASCAQEATGQTYMVKGMSHYIHIYKDAGKIYFEINSSPWTFLRMDDMKSFPKQDNPESPNIFYDAEFKLKYELRPGKTVTSDTLQLVDVTTDRPASWQLLNFSSQEWRALPTIKRSILTVDKAMIGLSAPDRLKQQQAKSTIEEWLNNEAHSLHLKDYQLIYQHLLSISKVECLSLVIGKEWLEHALYACALKIESWIEEKKSQRDEKPYYLFSDAIAPFDAQETAHELMSQVPERVAAARDRIERFLSLDKPTINQCEILCELLRSVLSGTLVERAISLSDKGDADIVVSDREPGINRLWLETQIGVCRKHIADARNDAFDVPLVVAELMVASTQVAAQQKIVQFLEEPRIERAKYSDLARRLTDLRIALQTKGADEHLIPWLNMAIDCACGGIKKEGVIDASVVGLQLKSVQSHRFPPPSAVSMPQVPTTAPVGRRAQVSTSMTALMRRMSTTLFHKNDKSNGSDGNKEHRKGFEGGPS